MNRAALVALALLASFLAALPGGARGNQPAQPQVSHTLRITQPQTQYIEVEQRLSRVSGEHVDFRLPIWRPGRYVVLNLAQSIRDFQAFDERDQPLPVEKTDKSTWRVRLNSPGAVRIAYRVYCNSLNDRTRHVDDTHAFLSGAAIFMYTDDTRALPAHLRIIKPEGWRVACGLDTTQDADVLFAPDYDTLVDAPLEIGLQEVIDFDAAGKPHQIVIWGEADDKPDDLRRDFAKIVEAQTKLFGSSPYERYLFIVHVGAGATGGTEHVNSTVMQTSRAALEESSAYTRFLNLVAHEFFHTWNIKSFRPKGLNPYEYQRENYTDLLWVVEGATTYYAALTLVRTGFTTPTRYLDSLADSIDAMRNKPGESVQSVAEASFDSWIHYGSRTPDDVNSTVDFYGKGALVSLLIDLQIRQRSQGKASLDDVMRALYQRFPLSGGRGYSTDDLQAIIEELADAEFDDVFEANVRGAGPLDFESAFKTVGLELSFRPADAADAATPARRGGRASAIATGGRARDADDDTGDADSDVQPEPAQSQPAIAPASQPQKPRLKAYLGLNLTDGGSASPSGAASSSATTPSTTAAPGRTTVTSVLADSPAFEAGVLAGDEILAINGRRVTAATLDARLRSFNPGDVITITSFRREQLRSTQITLAGKPDGRWTLRKSRNPTDEQKAAYEAWLGQKW